MQIHKALLLSALSLSLMGCLSNTDEENVACTTEFVPGLSIDVIDESTNESIACGVTVIIQDGNYEEGVTVDAAPGCDDTQKIYGAYERAGTYNIKAVKPGYLETTLSDVVVTENVCHVKTVNLTIELTAL